MHHLMTSLFLITATLAPQVAIHATEKVESRSFLSHAIEMSMQGESQVIPESVQLLQELQKEGRVIRTGTDAEMRPIFVGAQLSLERTLTQLIKEGKISEVIGIIHTPTLPTHLCREPTSKVNGEVAPEISQDAKRACTVTESAVYLREFLDEGGTLLVTYPKEGKELCSEKELSIFEGLLEKYDNLGEVPLSIESLRENLQGATYFFLDEQGDRLCFSLQSFQDNDPKDGREWGVWFGSLTQPLVCNRFMSVWSIVNNELDSH